jgi:hypothetical protein
MRRVALVALAIVTAACGGGGGPAKDAGQTRFLLMVHSPLAGAMASKPDAELVQLGRTACAGLDAQQPSDAVVTSMSGDALPGSAAFNDYSFLVVAAANDLCPAHRAEMQVSIPSDQ